MQEIVLEVTTKPVKLLLRGGTRIGLSTPKKSTGRHTEPRKVSARKKKTPEAKLKAELWELCKQIIRLKYGNTCYTCGATGLTGGNWHTAHFIARSICGASLRYDLRNLRPCCYRCNVSLAGNGSAFYRALVEREGQGYVDGIFADKERLIKTNRQWYEAKVAEYKEILAVEIAAQEKKSVLNSNQVL